MLIPVIMTKLPEEIKLIISRKFDKNLWIYIERKKVKKSIFKLGKEKYVSNNVLALKIDNKGLLKDKKIYRLDDMDDDLEGYASG